MRELTHLIFLIVIWDPNVEMESTRLRELTPLKKSCKQLLVSHVEMESTRLRELTHLLPSVHPLALMCRNGEYPIEGIDTSLCFSVRCRSKCVEMESTRLRELTQVCCNVADKEGFL